MKETIQIITAEVRKMHKNQYHSYSVYITLLIWPFLILFNTYYTYFSFNISILNRYSIYNKNDLMIFLVIGSLGLNIFFSMVQSSWQMSSERQDGTLEVIFYSPANRLTILYGRAISTVFENVWIFLVFLVYLLFLSENIDFLLIFKSFLSFIVLFISAVVWGVFLNSIFLFTRDASFLFNLMDSPMDFFSGVRFPTVAFPFVLRGISYIYPLTYCLNVFRKIFNSGESTFDTVQLVYLTMILVIMHIIAKLITKSADKKFREKDSFNFY